MPAAAVHQHVAAPQHDRLAGERAARFRRRLVEADAEADRALGGLVAAHLRPDSVLQRKAMPPLARLVAGWRESMPSVGRIDCAAGLETDGASLLELRASAGGLHSAPPCGLDPGAVVLRLLLIVTPGQMHLIVRPVAAVTMAALRERFAQDDDPGAVLVELRDLAAVAKPGAFTMSVPSGGTWYGDAVRRDEADDGGVLVIARGFAPP